MGSNGAFAEYVVVSEEILAHKPKELSFERITALPIAYVTAAGGIQITIAKRIVVTNSGCFGKCGKSTD